MHKFYRSRIEFVFDILKRIGKKNSRVILDVGFIGNRNEAQVHYKIIDFLRENDHIIGIDINGQKMKEFLANLKTKKRQKKYNLEYKLADIANTEFEGEKFDIILLLEVLEHLNTPYSVFNEIYRILKPKGYIILTYPNPLSLNKVLKYFTQKNLLKEQFLNKFKGVIDHKIFPHPICLANYLNNIGFKTKGIEFIKYNIKYFPFLKPFLCKFNYTKKLAEYIGIYAIKK